ncbi:DEAD/DEAH box helicase [Nocardioides coralli]|uniref:DEAD/DEAH box helicase n=1 Tax=Nocardioides coralli TaxID=2872154 RepID=UPI001CA4292F|nr:DEAD/DEAH box helicase [Nocardioides coralli]QZY29702.1 DEAD/DEAH box helicase family protein [Nocardioides coralli]
MAEHYQIVPSPQYLQDRRELIDNPRVLKDLTRLEALLSREGTRACKEIHRVGDAWTVYLGEGRRVLVRPEGTQVHLLRVGEHDDVYRAHARAGNPVAIEQAIAVGHDSVEEPRSADGVLHHLSDQFLQRLGVSESHFASLRACRHEGDVWELVEQLGENLTMRLVECLESPPEDVLAAYESRGKDDEAQALMHEAEEARLAEKEARMAAEEKAAEAHREADAARDELVSKKAELARAEQELSDLHSRSADGARVEQLESQVDALSEQLPRLLESIEKLDERARERQAQLENVPGPQDAQPSTPSASTTPHVTRRPTLERRFVPSPGTPWDNEPGRERWRLSAATRSMTRLSDHQGLAGVVGKDVANRLVSQFLAVRPEGGRVWVDQEGNAVTLAHGRHVFLGQIVGGASNLELPSDNSLRSAIIRYLSEVPDSTAREIAFALSRGDFPSVARGDVNSALYRDLQVFCKDDSRVPRWSLVHADGSAATVAGGPTRGETVAKLHRRDHDEGTAYADLVAMATPARTSPVQPVARRPVEPRPLPDQVLGLLTWQQEAMAAWYAHGCHGIVEAVTGTGKTHLGLEAAAHAATAGQRTTVLVPSVDLQQQWVERFATFLPHLRLARVGGHKAGDPHRADVTVAVVHSALTHDLSDLSDDSLVVADEVHRYGAEQFQYALRARYARRLGLTATLERSGDDAVEEVLLPYFGGSILTVDFDRALRENVVAPFKLVMAPISLDGEEQEQYDAVSRQISNGLKVLRNSGALKSGGGDVVRQLGRLRGASGQIGAAARSAESGMRARRRLLAGLTGKLDAIEELSELVEQSQGTVIFTQSKEVAEDAALRLREWGIKASALHGGMPDGERKQSVDGLASGRLQALAAPKLLDEGIDVPTVDLGVVMTASRSRRQMVQRLGRVIRRKSDGRPVRFVLLFAAGTVEDPASGVHEGFFDLVGEVARDKTVLEPGWTADDLLGLQP